MMTKFLNKQDLPLLRKRLEDDITVLNVVLQEKTGNLMINGLLKSLILIKYKLLDLMPFHDPDMVENSWPVSGEKIILKGYSSKYNLFLDDCDMLTDILRDVEKNQMDYVLKSDQKIETASPNKPIFQKIILIYQNIGQQLDEIRKTKEFLPFQLTHSL